MSRPVLVVVVVVVVVAVVAEVSAVEKVKLPRNLTGLKWARILRGPRQLKNERFPAMPATISTDRVAISHQLGPSTFHTSVSYHYNRKVDVITLMLVKFIYPSIT